MSPKGKMIQLLFVFFYFTAGCASTSYTASIGKKGLEYDNFDLKINFADASKGNFIGEKWQLLNWEKSVWTERWVRRLGPAFEGSIENDLNEDGTAEKANGYYFDLELRHETSDAEILLGARVLPPTRSKTDMTVFLSNVVENLSGTRTWRESSPYLVNLGKGRVFASRLLDYQVFQFQGYDSVIASIELANLDQLKLDPTHRSRKITVLFIKIDEFVEEEIYYMGDGSFRSVTQKVPALLSIMLSTRPANDDAALEDFFSFIRNIKIKGKDFNGVPLLKEASHDTAADTPENGNEL